MKASTGTYEATKRVIDLAGAGFGLVLSVPVMIAIAVAIKLEDGGPVFYRQQRLGRKFKPFSLLKFRSMNVAKCSFKPNTLSADESNITKVGAILRRSKLDELPQLVNVLSGEMSLVGPRPELEHYIRKFERDYREILDAKPGLTDEASLKYFDEDELLSKAEDIEKYYCDQVLPRKIELNKKYLGERSLMMDMKLLGQTVLKLLPF